MGHYQGCTNSNWCGTYIYIYITHPSPLLHRDQCIRTRVIFYRIGWGYWIPAGKDAVARFLSKLGGAVINILLHRYGEISLVSYGYCTCACGTRANTL